MCPQSTLTNFKQNEFSVVRQHEEFIWLHDSFVENEDYAGYIVRTPHVRLCRCCCCCCCHGGGSRCVDPSRAPQARLRRVQREAAEAGGGRRLHDKGGVHQDEAGAGGVSPRPPRSADRGAHTCSPDCFVCVCVSGSTWPSSRRLSPCTRSSCAVWLLTPSSGKTSTSTSSWSTTRT